MVATSEPDLRWMTPQTQGDFLAIVLGGMRRELGMRSFANVLTAEDANAVHQFVISEAIKVRTWQQAAAAKAAGDATASSANKPATTQPEPRG